MYVGVIHFRSVITVKFIDVLDGFFTCSTRKQWKNDTEYICVFRRIHFHQNLVSLKNWEWKRSSSDWLLGNLQNICCPLLPVNFCFQIFVFITLKLNFTTHLNNYFFKKSALHRRKSLIFPVFCVQIEKQTGSRNFYWDYFSYEW